MNIENLLISFNVVFPMFVLLAVGYGLKRGGMLGGELSAGVNKIVFYLFIPVLIFKNIIDADFSTAFDWKILLYSVAATTVIFAAAMALIPRFERDNPRRGAIAVAMYRSNFIVYGMPFATGLYGATAGAMLSILTALVVPLATAYSVFALEYFKTGKPDWRQILVKTVKNPYIIASVAGMLFLAAGIKLPNALYSPLGSVAQVASPLALIMLGARFDFSGVRKYLKYIVSVSLLRLVLVPGIFVSAAIALGFRGAALVTIMALFATPPATSAYTLVRECGGDEDLMSQLLVFITIASIVTVFLWIWGFKSLGVI
jgi:predicted permease